MIGDKLFQFKALPFRLLTTPLVFTSVMNVIAAYTHIHGVRVHMYQDYWLFRALDRLELMDHMHWLQDLCKVLGLLVNLLKLNLLPLKDFVFLGIHFPFVCHP